MSRRQFQRTMLSINIKPANPLEKDSGCISMEVTTKPEEEFSNNFTPVTTLSEDTTEMTVCSDISLSKTNSTSTTVVHTTAECVVDNFASDNYVNDCDQISLENKLQKLISKYHVSHNFVNELLVILRSEGLKLPKDSRTLLKTPKKHEIISIEPGSYIHIGIEFMITPILTKYFDKIKHTSIIKLSLNIDGLPTTKSSKSNFWPILISFIDIHELSKIVVPVGIYHGKFKKPNSISDFLNPFISEMELLLVNGLSINNKTFFLNISQVICDAPAKAFILNVKGHNAYHSCNSCIVEGVFLNNRMAFPDLNSSLRTNISFRNQHDEDYHKGFCPLTKFNTNIVDNVVLEYMHNICLGVVKRLLLFWKKGKKPVRFLNDDISNEVSSELICLKAFFPKEFSRSPRSLEELEYWKATEFRSFLLYSGPIVLKGRLKKSLYKHFMLLHCAIRLLLSGDTCMVYNDVANDLLRQFVEEYSFLYGEEYITYNVHGLIHIAHFVKIHGPLDKFSAFKFENYLQMIKMSLKNARFPLQDVFNRIIEQTKIEIVEPIASYPILKKEIVYNHLIHPDPTDTLYENVITENCILSSVNKKNMYFLLKNNVIICIKKIIKKANGSVYFEVVKYNAVPFFDNPLVSDIVGDFYVDIFDETDSFLINMCDIKHKCLFFSISDVKAVAITLLHDLY